MKGRLSSLVANGLLAIFAVVTAIDVIAASLAESVWSHGFHFVATFLGRSTAIGTVFLLAVVPRLPLSVFAPLAITPLIVAAIQARLTGFFFGPPPIELALVETLVFGLAVVHARLLTGRLPFTPAWFAGSRQSVARVVGLGFGGIALFLSYAFVSVVAVVGYWLAAITAGFLQVGVDGIWVAERVYVSDDRSIRLIGMQHVGQEDGYRSLFADLASAGPETVVLLEGVSDEQGLLDDAIDYEAIALALGVDTQGAIEDYVSAVDPDPDEMGPGPDYVHADVDTADFGDVTIEWLRRSGALYRSETPLADFTQLYLEMVRDPMPTEIALSDIVAYRNRALLAQIGESLDRYEIVVVPWGALHMPEIEAAVEEEGFEQVSERHVRIVAWSRVARAFVTRDGGV